MNGQAFEKWDLSRVSIRQLNQALHDLPADKPPRFRVLNPDGRHSVAVGVYVPVEIEIDGHVGYYCSGMNQYANVVINGNAGPGLAENMMSGRVQVKGNASQYCAARTALRIDDKI